MNTGKYILLFGLLVFSSQMIDAQSEKRNMPKKRVVLSSGDTTLVVNKLDEGLNGKDADFLFRDDRFKDIELFPEATTKYTSLEEAAFDITRLLEFMQNDEEIDETKGSRSLSYRAAKTERMKQKSEKSAKAKADSLLEKKKTESLAEAYEKFGNKPTYYLNGIEIEPSIIDLLFPDEILSRTVKVLNTRSGNPNGEIWYKVPMNVLVDLGIIDIEGKGTPVDKLKQKNDALDFIHVRPKKN